MLVTLPMYLPETLKTHPHSQLVSAIYRAEVHANVPLPLLLNAGELVRTRYRRQRTNMADTAVAGQS